MAAEPHPAHAMQATPAFLQLWADGNPVHPAGSEPLLTPDDLRRWARALDQAADTAEQVTTW